MGSLQFSAGGKWIENYFIISETKNWDREISDSYTCGYSFIQTLIHIYKQDELFDVSHSTWNATFGQDKRYAN